MLLLEHNADFLCPDKWNVSAIVTAVNHGQGELVELMMENGNTTAMTPEVYDAILKGAMARTGSLPQILLSYGALIDSRSNSGHPKASYILSALPIAAESGKDIVLAQLPDQVGINNLTGAVKSEILEAALSNHPGTKALETLLDRGLDPNHQTNDGQSALVVAMKSRVFDSAALLIRRGADPESGDYDGWTALICATATGVDVLPLLGAGSEMEAKDNNGRTALFHAVCGSASNHDNIISILLARGADHNARDNNGWTPLRLAWDIGREARFTLLLDDGADPNVQDCEGKTLLHVIVDKVAQKWHVDFSKQALIQRLLDAGADPTICDHEGTSAYLRAKAADDRTLVPMMDKRVARAELQ